MEWFTSARASFFALAADDRQDQATAPAAQAGLEEVRQAMLDVMEDAGPTEQHLDLLIRINYAGVIQTLWYARSDVMQALAAARGEIYARQQLERLSGRFVGLLPEARHYRPGRRPR